ncbi:HAD-IA family hydrolase, partial [Escherichia coli]|nr:HAD-IA family hydrolase [Escherichia coli]
MIKNIYISSDFLMTKEKEQFSNVKWLYEVLKRPIEQSSGKKARIFTSSLTALDKFSRIEFFKKSNVELNIHKTQFYYNHKDIINDSLAYLHDFISHDDLVIGYELSEQTRSILTRANIKYVDIWLHPVRFLDDVLFGFSSNDRNVFKKLGDFYYPTETYWLYADRLRISAFKGWKRIIDNIKIKPNSALFIGQTLEDKAVSKNGKMLNLLDFKKEFEQLGIEYGKVYYSRHPFLKNEDKHIIDYVESCGFASVINEPTYYLLSHPNISKVVTISSSVATEAKYFDKQIEFLYQPIFNESKEFGDRNYIPIFQDFMTSHFWSIILSPITETRVCPKIEFLNKKDKIRDMLGFYWGYKQIDKNEYIRNWLLAVDRKMQSFIANSSDKTPGNTQKKLPETLLPLTKINNKKMSFKLKEIKRKIDGAKVVSFDIFDTLLVRDLDTPSDLFDIMHDDALSLLGDSVKNFKEERLNARKLVVDHVGEEITIEQRYEALCEKLGVKKSIAKELTNLELKFEMIFCRKREVVYELYNYAKLKGKKVIITSDIFFRKEFIQKLLNKNGYAHWDKLYLSSEVGLLKHTGNLFDYIKKDLNISAGNILHIGDNQNADIKMAVHHGIAAVYMPRTIDCLKEKSFLLTQIDTGDKKLNAIIKGIIGNKFCDNPFLFKENTLFSGEPYKLGYGVLGYVFFGFAQWIYRNSIQDNIKRIYFLSRDGDIIKKVYDVVAKLYPNAPESYYLLASRRSVNVASIKTTEDIKSLFDVNFSPVSLKKLFLNRLGFDISKHHSAISASGFTDMEQSVSYRSDDDRAKLNALIDILSGDILLHTQHERDELINYYRNEGLLNNENYAIVDIGHNGTMQRSLFNLLGKQLVGYYFCTFSEIDKNITKDIGSAKGYIHDKLNPKTSAHSYSKNILMYEMAFLNNQGSFVRFHHGKPVYLSVRDEGKRVKFANDLHKGIIDFNIDLVSRYGHLIDEIKVSPTSSIKAYSYFLNQPNYIDANAFMDISFENRYSCRDIQFLLTDKNDSSLWKKGEQVIKNHKDILRMRGRLTRVVKVMTPFITLANKTKLINNKKFSKFKS